MRKSIIIIALLFCGFYKESTYAVEVAPPLAPQFGCCRILNARGTFVERQLDFSFKRDTNSREEIADVKFINPDSFYYRRQYQLRLNFMSGFPDQQYVFVPRADEYRIRRLSFLPMEEIEGTPLPYFFLTIGGYLLHNYDWDIQNGMWHGVPKKRYDSIHLPIVDLVLDAENRLTWITAGAYTLTFQYRDGFEIALIEIEKDGRKETIKINSWDETVSLP